MPIDMIQSLKSKRKINIFLLAFGAVNIAWGVTTFLFPGACWYGYCWDESAYNVPLGIGLTLLGVVMVLVALRKGQRDYKEVFACPECETALPLAEAGDAVCPKCGARMEPLKGFYDRHPELK